ncbi:MAG: hypothetical protein ACYC3K_15300 [Candidatus Nanopelagicales bacterium]
MSERLSDPEHRLYSLTSRDVESRLADNLLGLPSTWLGGVSTVTLPLAKKDVACLLDTSPRELQPGSEEPRRAGSDRDRYGWSVLFTQPDRLQQLVDEA